MADCSIGTERLWEGALNFGVEGLACNAVVKGHYSAAMGFQHATPGSNPPTSLDTESKILSLEPTMAHIAP